MTEYIILRARKGEDPDTWERMPGTIPASSPERAIRGLNHTAENTYAAVPARSWRPLTVKVENTVITVG